MMTVVYLVGALTAPFPAEAHYLVPKAIRYHGPVGDAARARGPGSLASL